MANPIMAFMAFFLPCTKPKAIFGWTLFGLIFAGYLLGTALNSPDMLLGQDVGGALTVSFSFVKGKIIFRENAIEQEVHKKLIKFRKINIGVIATLI